MATFLKSSEFFYLLVEASPSWIFQLVLHINLYPVYPQLLQGFYLVEGYCEDLNVSIIIFF